MQTETNRHSHETMLGWLLVKSLKSCYRFVKSFRHDNFSDIKHKDPSRGRATFARIGGSNISLAERRQARTLLAMAWNAEAKIQLVGVIISILGIGIACYNHQFIIAAGLWTYSMLILS